jgi:hypothetical protein
MKLPLTSKELEVRFRKTRKPLIAEVSGELTIQARTAHIQAFVTEVKRNNPKKSLLLVALEE